MTDKIDSEFRFELQCKGIAAGGCMRGMTDQATLEIIAFCKTHFIEQACDAASDYLEANTEIDSIYLTGVEQAIRDKFNSSESS